jgi:hypothetical protein
MYKTRSTVFTNGAKHCFGLFQKRNYAKEYLYDFVSVPFISRLKNVNTEEPCTFNLQLNNTQLMSKQQFQQQLKSLKENVENSHKIKETVNNSDSKPVINSPSKTKIEIKNSTSAQRTTASNAKRSNTVNQNNSKEEERVLDIVTQPILSHLINTDPSEPCTLNVSLKTTVIVPPSLQKELEQEMLGVSSKNVNKNTTAQQEAQQVQQNADLSIVVPEINVVEVKQTENKPTSSASVDEPIELPEQEDISEPSRPKSPVRATVVATANQPDE